MTYYGTGLYGAGLYSGTDAETELSAFTCFPIILIEMELADGTIYLAGETVRFHEKMYEGKVLAIGQFRRALQQNLGIFEVSSIDVQIADTDRELISNIDESKPKGALVTFKLGTDALPVADYRVIHQGKIDDFGANNFTFRLLVRDRLWTLPPLPDTGTITTEDFPDALPKDVGKPIPVCYGSHSDTGTDDAKNRGAWPTLYVDVRSSERTFLIAGHAVKDIAEVYAYKPSAGSQLLTETTDYVAYPNGTLNSQTMAFIKLTTTGFNKLADATDLGVLSVNVDGKEENGDGTGDLILNPIDVLRDLFGNYLGSPQLNGAKFSEAEVVAQSRSYVTRGGYTAEKKTDELLRDFCNSFNIRIYPDSSGQISIDIYEPSGPSEGVVSLKEQWDIINGSFSIDFVSGIDGAEDAQVVNFVDYDYGYHHAKNFFDSSSSVSDSDSIANYGDKKLKMTLPWAGTSGTAQDVAYRILILYRNPVPHVTCKLPLLGMLVDLTDQVLLSHADGTVPGGFDSKTFEVLEQVFNPSDFSVDVRLRDVSTISQGAYFFGDEDLYERVSDGTVAVTNGSADINATGNTSWVTAGVAVDDIIEILDPTNGANLLTLKITAVTDLNTIQTANTVWVNESGMSYRIMRSWLTATDEQRLYGHLCDETTGEFSNGDEGFVLL